MGGAEVVMYAAGLADADLAVGVDMVVAQPVVAAGCGGSGFGEGLICLVGRGTLALPGRGATRCSTRGRLAKERFQLRPLRPPQPR
jgi:hypothetical protein